MRHDVIVLMWAVVSWHFDNILKSYIEVDDILGLDIFGRSNGNEPKKWVMTGPAVYDDHDA